jgi:hypothetical protein
MELLISIGHRTIFVLIPLKNTFMKEIKVNPFFNRANCMGMWWISRGCGDSVG